MTSCFWTATLLLITYDSSLNFGRGVYAPLEFGQHTIGPVVKSPALSMGWEISTGGCFADKTTRPGAGETP